jgi:hypothetical protein
MRIFFVLMVFCYSSWVFANASGGGGCGIGCGAPAPAPPKPSSPRLKAAALQNTYNLQTLTMINGLTYDTLINGGLRR